MDVPAARRIARPSWINVRTVLGVLLFALAFLGGQRALEQARTTVAVWAAARDLAADTVVGSGDLELVEVRLPDELLALYARGEQVVEGETLTRAVRAGELIPAEAVAASAASATGRSMTIPVTPEHANGGVLHPGDRVDVFATFDAGDVRARTVTVVHGVEVLDLVSAGGLVSGQESAVGLTVSVTPEDASRLAFAIRTADIDVARITGRASPGQTATVRSGDFE
jgi:Flp pilus assembly protein CpaB